MLPFLIDFVRMHYIIVTIDLAIPALQSVWMISVTAFVHMARHY